MPVRELSGCSIIIAHAAIDEKPEDKAIEKIYNEYPRRGITIVLGDMNAQIGKQDIYIPTIGKCSLYSQSNNNGLRLILLTLEER